MNNKYIIGFMAVIFQLIGQTLMKGGLGYVEDGVRIVPGWAEVMGATAAGFDLQNLRDDGFMETTAGIFTNIPLLVGFFFVVLYGISIIVLVSKAGLVFVNAMLMIFMVLISFVSFWLFGEFFGAFKLTGMIIIITGFIMVLIGEKQAEQKGLIE